MFLDVFEVQGETYQVLTAVLNAIGDNYEFPLIKENCDEKKIEMGAVRRAVRKLPKAFRDHRRIMENLSISCGQKREEIEKANDEDPQLQLALRAAYLGLSKYYVVSNGEK
ncbi:hypothetical protein OESDEN_16027 [Oesophagostomum dentatum]|uniref:Uncharacterized protein n=1 Tax=Oesophagostomum dentatum TaxID=61180 RepID=A0A0B1SL59_OESDE|nr:hypothetical protein OESDEN_16027 [Oesophagostomum dentatum]